MKSWEEIDRIVETNGHSYDVTQTLPLGDGEFSREFPCWRCGLILVEEIVSNGTRYGEKAGTINGRRVLAALDPCEPPVER